MNGSNMSLSKDSKTFYKLINNQQISSIVQLHWLVVDGRASETEEEILKGRRTSSKN